MKSSSANIAEPGWGVGAWSCQYCECWTSAYDYSCWRMYEAAGRGSLSRHRSNAVAGWSAAHPRGRWSTRHGCHSENPGTTPGPPAACTQHGVLSWSVNWPVQLRRSSLRNKQWTGRRWSTNTRLLLFIMPRIKRWCAFDVWRLSDVYL